MEPAAAMSPEPYSTFYLFFTGLSAGITGALVPIPARGLGRRFFVLCTVLALVFTAAAIVKEGLALSHWHLAGSALLIAYNVTLPKEGGRVSRGLLGLAALASLSGVWLDGQSFLPLLEGFDRGPFSFLPGTASVSSALTVGTALVAMTLGHFYLVVPGLSFAPLIHGVHALLVSLVLRALLWGVALIAQRDSLNSLWQRLGPEGFALSHGFFLALHLLFGIVGAAVLAWMSLVCAKEKSNQSATGILYVAVAFTLIGEIIARHMLVTARLLL